MNHNVRIMFAVRIADGIATGIWASSVLSTYINVLEGADDHANEVRGMHIGFAGLTPSMSPWPRHCPSVPHLSELTPLSFCLCRKLDMPRQFKAHS